MTLMFTFLLFQLTSNKRKSFQLFAEGESPGENSAKVVFVQISFHQPLITAMGQRKK